MQTFHSLRTFSRFERGLAGYGPPFRALKVSHTVGLFSSPGSVVLYGEAADVLTDVRTVREDRNLKIESTEST